MTSQTPSVVYRRPESVLVVVYNQSQQVLLLERSQPAGYWQSVTGSLESGESAADCARRELFEETGFLATPRGVDITNRFKILPQWRARYAPDVTMNTEYVFGLQLEQCPEPRLNAQEHTRYTWQDAQTAMHWCFSRSNAEAIKSIVLRKC